MVVIETRKYFIYLLPNMNQNQKATAHILLIPAQIAVHIEVDESLKNKGVGAVGRGLAQIIMIGLGAAVHVAVESA